MDFGTILSYTFVFAIILMILMIVVHLLYENSENEDEFRQSLLTIFASILAIFLMAFIAWIVVNFI